MSSAHKIKTFEANTNQEYVLDLGRFFLELDDEDAVAVAGVLDSALRAAAVAPGAGGWECHEV